MSKPAGDTAAELYPPRHAAAAPVSVIGLVYGVLSFGTWGAVPLYFNTVEHVPPLEVLSHRIVWCLLVLALLVTRSGRWVELARALRRPRTVATLLATAVFIGTNWFVFIYAIVHDVVFEVSLGYFINPLVSIGLGYVFLGERMRRPQLFSVALAALAVGAFLAINGSLPAVALILAMSFGFYGLLRKTAPVDGLLGLTVETAIMTPIALTLLIRAELDGTLMFAHVSWGLNGLLMLAGLVTAVPLLWFVAAARRLRLMTIGFLQFLAPTGHFLCAIYFGEAFKMGHALTFALIWLALAIYTADAVRETRRLRRPRPLSVEAPAPR